MKRKKLLNVILSAVLAFSLVAPFSSYLVVRASGSYTYYTPVTIDHTKVDATLTDFPVVIASTISQLATTANGGHVENTDSSGGVSGSLEVPADFIVASDTECTSQLDHEFEHYDKTTGEIVLHFKVSSLSDSTDTTIYLCYGDATTTTSQENVSGVWSNNYAGVWHMAETGSTYYDSANGNNGSDSNITNSDRSGVIGSGQAFDGNDYIAISGSSSLSFSPDITVTVWEKWVYKINFEHMIENGGNFQLLEWQGNDPLNAYYAGGDHRSNDGNDGDSPFNFAEGEWFHLAFRVDGGSSYTYYFNSVSDGVNSSSDSVSTNTGEWNFGYWDYSGGNRFYHGAMDEIRISSEARTEAWISTSYKNQSSPGSFYSVGSEISTADTTDPTLSSTSPIDGATDVSTTANLTLTFSEAVDAESGNITIYDASDDSTFETIDVTGAKVSGSGSDTITVDPSGTLSYSTSYYVQVDATAFDDAAGNSYAGISDTTSWDFTTGAEPDTTDPTLSSTSPTDGATDVSTTANLIMTFSEAVDAESGNITIFDASDDSTFETIDVTGAKVSGSGSDTITVDPDTDFTAGTSYYVQIDATAFDDPSGNSYAGISDTTSWDFSVPALPAVAWGTHSVTVSSEIETALDTALNSYRPDEELENPANMWVVTDISDSENTDYDYVSIVGLIVDDPSDPDVWSLADAAWTGLAILRDNGDTTYTAGVEGSTTYDNLIDDADVDDPAYQPSGGTGSYQYYFPWVAGTHAYFGTKGIHYDVGPPGTGYGGSGWAAIDWVGGSVGYADNVYPNGAYVAQSGKISYVCRDDVQTWVQIGNFLYGHLVDNSNLRMNHYHSQGDYLGALVTGTHLTANATCNGESGPDPGVHCGYTCQRDTSYHLHLGFKPDGNYFQVEDWVLNLTTETWTRGSDTVGPGQYMLAEWSSSPDPAPTPGPTPTPGGATPTPIPYNVEGGGGGHIWDGFLAGAERAVDRRVDDMSSHEERRIVELTTSGVRIAVSTVYVLLRSNLDLTITMIVFGLLMILEPVRIIRSIWMGIKEMIPFAG